MICRPIYRSYKFRGGIFIETILQSLYAFNINAIANLRYVILNNWWFLLILAACICTMVLSWKEKKVTIIEEEQNIL